LVFNTGEWGLFYTRIGTEYMTVAGDWRACRVYRKCAVTATNNQKAAPPEVRTEKVS